MATLNNVNLFAPKDPETGKTYELFDAAAIKQKQEQQKQQRDEAARVLAEELEAGNIKKAYEEGFTQLPIGEQLLYYINPVTGVPIETYETGYFTKEGGLEVKTPREMLVDAIDPRKNIFQKSFLKAEDPLSAAIAPLSALGALGGIGELANIPKAGLMALRRFQQKTMDGGGGGIGGLPRTTLDNDVDKFARYNTASNIFEGAFVSPTIEALIRNAPKNIKGKQIIEYLNSKGAPSAGVKPKELPYLRIERFIEENPNATLPEVIEHASQNKVVIDEVVYKDIGEEGSDFYFDRSTPELDPIDGSPLHAFEAEELSYSIKTGDKYETENIIADFNTANPQAKVKSISDIENYLSIRGENFEDFIDNVAKKRYEDNPYILIEPKGEGFVGGYGTFAFGNDDVGYTTFINGERIDIKDYGYDDVAYSEAEAKVRLQRILDQRGDIDIGMYEGNQRYKIYVDETLPGGKNYSEKVYIFENTDEVAPPLGHFNEDTQVAHKLGRDRLLEDGTLSVHADEIQSDFHKEGSKYGYIDPIQDKQIRLELIAQNKISYNLHKKIVERMREELDEIKELAAKHPELNNYRGQLDGFDRDLAIRKLSGQDQGQIVFDTNQDTEIFLDHLRNKYGDSSTINNFRVPSKIQSLERNVLKAERDLAVYEYDELPRLDDVESFRGRQVPQMPQTKINIKNGSPESVTTVLEEFKQAVNKPDYANKIKKIQELEVESTKINQELAENFLRDFNKFTQQYPDADLSSINNLITRIQKDNLTNLEEIVSGGMKAYTSTVVEMAYKRLQQIELNTLAARANTNLDVLSDPRNVDVTNPALARLLDADLNFSETPVKAKEQIDKIKNNRQEMLKLTDDTTIDAENLLKVEDYVSDDFIELQNLDKKIEDKNINFRSKVPNYPFKGDDYGEMVLKNMILDAIKEGKDAISVSASRPILERYNMTPGSDEAQFFERFYDSTLPKSMNKIAKKYGGKFERGKLDIDDTFGEGASDFTRGTTFAGNPRNELVKSNILRITPEMKQKIIKEGLPLFNMGGKVTKSKFMDKPIEGNRREM